METNAAPPPQTNKTPAWLIGLVAVGLVALAGYYLYLARATSSDTKYAFASDHYFDHPLVFFGGNGLKFQIVKTDTRLLKVSVPATELGTPKYLLAEDGELDYLGFVRKDRTFVPLELFQIHNIRIGRPNAPVSDCKTYLQVQAPTDTIQVLVDDKYLLRGIKTGPGMYAVPFCETTREHHFQVLNQSNALAMKSAAPVVYSMIGSAATSMNPYGKFSYRIKSPGDTIRMGLAPAQYAMENLNPEPSTLLQAQKGAKTAMTKVVFSMPRKMSAPWVYLNDRRLKDFTLNAAGNQVSFWVKQDGQAVGVRVGDTNCECQSSGRALHSTLELAGYCECRDIQVTVQLDPGLDRFRNKIKIYIDGQLTDLNLPPAGKPFVFPVRKADRDQSVALKLLMVDDSGKAGLIDLCDFTVPQEATTVNLNPSCLCSECPPNIKVSGK